MKIESQTGVIEKRREKGYNITIILNIMYEKKQNPDKSFQLHVSVPHVGDNTPRNDENFDENQDSGETKPEEGEEGGRTLKTVFKDISRQIIASVIILVVGFFVLNWSAYTKIAQNAVDEYFGVPKGEELHKLVDEKPVTDDALKVETTPEMQKKQIPALNIEVMPVDNRLIIPRIDQNIPIVNVSSENLLAKDWNALEKDMQEALKGGVVHYPGTSVPGDTGNAVMTGHSSYFPWDPGKFKDVFALLHKVVVGDKIVVYYEQQKYVYEVTEIKVVTPDNIEVLKQTPTSQLTLITCTPVGTNLKRLIVIAKPVEL